MSSLMTEIEVSNAVEVKVDDKTLTVTLDDGRVLSLPISWYPRLYYGSQQERNNYRLIGNGEGIHWEDLDEDISIEGIIAGHHSQESQTSLDRWLKSRGRN
jgi:hypothetical protein